MQAFEEGNKYIGEQAKNRVGKCHLDSYENFKSSQHSILKSFSSLKFSSFLSDKHFLQRQDTIKEILKETIFYLLNYYLKIDKKAKEAKLENIPLSNKEISNLKKLERLGIDKFIKEGSKENGIKRSHVLLQDPGYIIKERRSYSPQIKYEEIKNRPMPNFAPTWVGICQQSNTEIFHPQKRRVGMLNPDLQ